MITQTPLLTYFFRMFDSIYTWGIRNCAYWNLIVNVCMYAHVTGELLMEFLVSRRNKEEVILSTWVTKWGTHCVFWRGVWIRITQSWLYTPSHWWGNSIQDYDAHHTHTHTCYYIALQCLAWQKKKKHFLGLIH